MDILAAYRTIGSLVDEFPKSMCYLYARVIQMSQLACKLKSFIDETTEVTPIEFQRQQIAHMYDIMNRNNDETDEILARAVKFALPNEEAPDD